jgi:hypothetical protein
MRLAIACVLAMGCMRHVQQDRATGTNGRIEGAKAMRLAAPTTWEARGIVTYPGGDRVDWHTVTVPPVRGTVAIELRITTPRPGLRVGFDVFDDNRMPLGRARHGNRRIRRVELERVRGPLFIRVFAVNRGDAGRYSLRVAYTPLPAATDWTTYAFDDPPKLPEVPEPEPVCTAEDFDPKRRECQKICPPNPPPYWPGCTGPPPNWCPDPPDPRIRACRDKLPRCDVPDPRNGSCPQPPSEATGRIVKAEVQGDSVIITIAVGQSAGVGKHWRGSLVRDRDGTRPLPGGDVTIIRVDKQLTVAKVKATIDQVHTTPWVHLKAP